VAAFLAPKRKVKGKGFMYLGTTPSVHAINKLKGDLDIEAISLLDDTPSSQAALMKELSAIRGPAWGECVASDRVVSQILRQTGFSYVTSSVNSFSDVMAMYFKGTAQERQQRTVAVDEAQLVNLKRFPVGNVSALARKIAARLNKKKLHFTSHNSNYNRNDAWSALALRGYLPDPTYIHDPEEANRGTSEKDMEELKKWERRYPKRHWGLQDTALMKQFPEVQELLDTLIPNSSKNGNTAFKRVRLMRLKPQGGELTRHTDLTDGTLGLDDGKTVRIHFPIKTNPKVLLTSWDLHDQPVEKHFPVGECWYLNIWLPHKIVNGGTEDRFHLVMDLIAHQRIQELIGGKQQLEVQRSTPSTPTKDTSPAVAARLARSIKPSLFTVREVTDASYKKCKVDRKRLHEALRIMGRQWLHKKSMTWSEGNPTHNYCYIVAEWMHRYIAPSGSLTFRVDVPGDPHGHLFNVYPDGAIVDLAAEQFGANAKIPYYTAKPYKLLQSGGKQPSKRAQLLNHLYDGGSLSDFRYTKKSGSWKSATPYEPSDAEKNLKRWRDPYPKPKHEPAGDFFVVRDDLLPEGSKARFLDAVIHLHPKVKEWVFGSCPAQGFGQVSLSAACQKAKCKAVLFMADRSAAKYTEQQKKGLALGGDYRWIHDGMLVVTQFEARKYVECDPKRRRLLPIGFNTEEVVTAIVKVAKTIKAKPPKEIWTVGSSGTLSRGLQLAFPKAQINVVSVGHHMSFDGVGRARLWRHPYKFERAVSLEYAPPYPTITNYDGKVWSFVCAHAKRGAWIWNVAGNPG
jgi:hypothetical protein